MSLLIKSEIIISFILIMFAPVHTAFAVEPGKSVSNVQIRDLENNPVPLPELGKKIIAIWYTDPDAARQNEKLAKRLKEAKIPWQVFYGYGVANLKDAPLYPDFVVRLALRQQADEILSHDTRVKKAPLFSDPNHILKNAWDLKDTDDNSVVMLIDTSKQIRYIKYGKLNDEEIQKFMRILNGLIRKGKFKKLSSRQLGKY